jgi:hypothetical protein
MIPLRTAAALDEPALVGRLGSRQPREARVRQEFAALYPGLRLGEWAAAAVVADRVLADCLLRGRATAIRGRVLPDAHFEFRGSGSESGERSGVRFGAQM